MTPGRAGAALDLVVLCAGRGERLRPLTDSCPKPLLPVVGITMADRALLAGEKLGPVRRIANAHHLPEQVQVWAEARHLDHVLVEPELLDTGGTLGRLESLGELVSQHVLVHNGDLVHDIDLEAAWSAHLESSADATLVCVDRPRVNTVVVREGRFKGVLGHPRGPREIAQGRTALTFSGIAFYKRRVFAGRADGVWSVKEVWHDLLESEATILVHKPGPESRWSDLGTASEYARAIQEDLRRRGLVSWIDPSVEVPATTRILPGCSVEIGVEIGAGAMVEKSVLLPGAVVLPGECVNGILRNASGDLPWHP